MVLKIATSLIKSQFNDNRFIQELENFQTNLNQHSHSKINITSGHLKQKNQPPNPNLATQSETENTYLSYLAIQTNRTLISNHVYTKGHLDMMPVCFWYRAIIPRRRGRTGFAVSQIDRQTRRIANDRFSRRFIVIDID